jgi:hypothetical protein
MFTDFSHLIAQSDQHRQDLLADAESYRVARLARTHRRDRSGVAAAQADPPESARRRAPAQRNEDRKEDAERRYAVSR